MLNVYYTNINFFEFDDLIKHFWEFISEERKNQIKRLKFEEDKKRALLAEILLLNALVHDFSVNIKDIRISKNEYGKPYLVNSEMYHNISHSGEYVLCAVSDKCVGIDIEEYGNCSKELIKYFHPLEIIEYNKLKPINQNNFFYDYWSLKKSYVKYFGIGLSYSFDSFNIVKNNRVYSVIGEDNVKFHGKLERLNIDSNYACFICYEAARIDKVKKVEMYDLNY